MEQDRGEAGIRKAKTQWGNGRMREQAGTDPGFVDVPVITNLGELELLQRGVPLPLQGLEGLLGVPGPALQLHQPVLQLLVAVLLRVLQLPLGPRRSP